MSFPTPGKNGNHSEDLSKLEDNSTLQKDKAEGAVWHITLVLPATELIYCGNELKYPQFKQRPF